MDQKVYTLEEYAEVIDRDWREFYTFHRLAGRTMPVLAEPRSLDEWDQAFDDHTAESRRHRGLE